MSLQKRLGRMRWKAPARRFLTRRVGIDRIRFEYGFGFGDLYHPYAEVLKSPTIAEGQALLESFYEAMENWRARLNNWQALPIQAWRFGKTNRAERLEKRIPSIHFGPILAGGPGQARARVEHLFGLRDSIDRNGYRTQNSQPIDGVFVGTTFLVLGGQHRVAVLDSLRWETISVMTIGRKNTPRKLIASRLPLVKSGHLPLDDARQILLRVEKGFSQDEAVRWGFPFAGSKPPDTS
jgi:hypothetical protein